MPQPEEFNEALTHATARLDAVRAQGLKGMESLTTARQAALEREEGRLAQALGAEHPRVKALALRREDGAARLRDLKREVARAVAVAPKAGATEWVLHGYVWSADMRPAPDLAVALVDAQGHWLRALGFAGTDERGYFQLRAAVPAEGKAGAFGPATGAHAPEAFVRITDHNRAQVHRGVTGLSISPGRVEYEEIVLDAEGSHGPVSPEDDLPGKPEPAGHAPKTRKRT